MLRKLNFLATLLSLLIPFTPSHAKDTPPPSVGDLARQARKDKEKNASKPKTVITDDNLPAARV